ncbi:MAG TPA: Gfo/Idh/MocA family oxidoreductase [Ardenticatenaceae bacterium]|nr:Gfo/Idh/MocA family oxidoreductase [Ardenticatenaceae bacterium]
MTPPLRVALIGAGTIGRLRAQAILESPGLDLVAVADVLEDRAVAVAERYGAAALADPLRAAERPDVDLVVISTPPNQHAALALAAMNAEKHVLCEKPLADTIASAEGMCSAAEASHVFLKTGFNHRYFPAMVVARQLIDVGTIGEVVAVEAHAGHPGGAEFGPGWVTDAAVTGGGALVDNGIHILDLTRFFLGEEVVAAMGYTANLVWPFEGAEDNAFALFRSASGKIARVHATWTDWRGYRFWIETHGTRGFVRAAYPPMRVEWGQSSRAGVRARRRYKLFPLFQVQERLKSWRWTIVRSFVDELTSFAAGIHGGKAVPATGRDGLRALQMAHAIYRSSREGIEVRF